MLERSLALPTLIIGRTEDPRFLWAHARGHTAKEPVLGPLRTLFNVGAIGDMTDGQLLERFAAGGEAAELAFAALVERHGAVVLQTCRSILRDEHEAEDAFQATFLVLVRKSGSLWVRDSLGPWLHQVAYRAAQCARSAAARRTAHERKTAERIAERNDRGTTEPMRRGARTRGGDARGDRAAAGALPRRRSCSATSKAAPTSRRHGTWAARSARSRADWPGAVGCSETV